MGEADLRRAVDRWFIRRGLPHFGLRYRSDTDVWTRASPFLLVVFLLNALGSAADVRGARSAAVVAVSAGLVIYLVVMNLRAGRPFYALPRRIGGWWLVAFVAVPTLLTYVARGQWQPALETAVLALFILGVTWLITWTAVFPLAVWAVRWTIERAADTSRVTLRALPLLLIFVTVIFMTTEVWQAMGSLSAMWLWLTIGLLLLIGVAFMASRVPGEIKELESLSDRAAIEAACAKTPLAGVVDGLDDLGTPEPLTRMQRLNLGFVIVMAQAVQIGLFAVMVWLFFLLLGILAVSIPVQQAWMAGLAPVDVIWSWTPVHGLTRESLRVATFIAGFSALYTAVASSSDKVYREHFHDHISESISRVMAVRQAYVAYDRENRAA